MIMTRKEYKELKESGDPAWETIKALRNVARAADTVRELPANEAYFALKKSLDALPAWMLEDERS